ncbi:MAG TPA: hypothetical protein VD794_01220 [Flavisolibacter sp.]|nr:hypothetical protein [Flavisolibacter sp.]
MSRSKTVKHFVFKTTGIACGLLLSLASYSQADSSQPVPKTFIFSKYQLPVKSDESTTSFFSAPVKASPYKIHYKIKTLDFPSDPDPKPKRFNVIDALITSYLSGEYKENNNNTIVPFKKHP